MPRRKNEDPLNWEGKDGSKSRRAGRGSTILGPECSVEKSASCLPSPDIATDNAAKARPRLPDAGLPISHRQCPPARDADEAVRRFARGAATSLKLGECVDMGPHAPVAREEGTPSSPVTMRITSSARPSVRDNLESSVLSNPGVCGPTPRPRGSDITYRWVFTSVIQSDFRFQN